MSARPRRSYWQPDDAVGRLSIFDVPKMGALDPLPAPDRQLLRVIIRRAELVARDDTAEYLLVRLPHNLFDRLATFEADREASGSH